MTDSFCHAGEPAATPNVVVPITTDPQRRDEIEARAWHQTFVEQARRLREPIFPLTLSEPRREAASVTPITTDEIALARIGVRAAHQTFSQMVRELEERPFRATSSAPVAEERGVEPPIAGPNVVRFPQGPRAAEGVVDAE